MSKISKRVTEVHRIHRIHEIANIKYKCSLAKITLEAFGVVTLNSYADDTVRKLLRYWSIETVGKMYIKRLYLPMTPPFTYVVYDCKESS